MYSPFFSIIVPVYKVEGYLHQCVQSVIDQSFSDFELILVDDGSPDECPSICDEFAREDRRVSVIHKENGGLSDARNAGIGAACGEYIVFLDSDDYWDNENALEKIKEIADEEGPDVITWRFKKLFDEKAELSSVGYDIDASEKEFALNMIASRSLLSSANMKAMKRALFEQNDLLFEKGVYSEDVEWCARVIRAAKKIIPSNLDFYVYRQRNSSITHEISKKNIDDLRKHICSIEKLTDEESVQNKELITRYLAEEFVNFVVTLTVYNGYRDQVSWVRQKKYILKRASTRKGKILRLMLNTIGVNLSLRLIKKIR